MTGIIIATIGFVLSIIALVIALIVKTKENERLKQEKRQKKWETMFHTSPVYDVFHQFVKVSGVKQETIRKHIKSLEADGYHYNKDKSFQTILCFTKYVEVKEPETPSESPT